MAYRKQQARMLGHSLAWLPPGDLIDAGQALQLNNFRADQAGILRSRQGHASISTGMGSIRAARKALGVRYVSGGTALWADGASIDGSYDGEPISLVDWKGYLWAMNRSKQRKTTSTTPYAWGITEPSATPAAAPATEAKTTIRGFEESDAWLVSPTGFDSYDGDEKQDGASSLLIEAAGEETFTLTSTGSLDLSSYSAEDKQRIWIYASKFKKVEQIILQLDCNTGDFKTDYFEVVLPRATLKSGGRGWKRFEIRREEKAEDTLPFFKRVGSTAAKGWDTIAAERIILDTRDAVDVRFDLWEMFGALDSIEGDNIQYYFTYVNANNHESNSSPASVAKKIDRTGVSLTGLTASADAQVTKKWIYRVGGGLSIPYRITDATGVANGTTTYTDDMNDLDALAQNIPLETDNDLPPSGRVAVGPYLGRILAASSAANPARLWWSKLNKPYAFPGGLDTAEVGNFADVGSTSEAIVQIVPTNQVAYIYKTDSIWRCVGDPDDSNGILEKTNAGRGLVSNQAVTIGEGLQFFESKEGIFSFNGDTTNKLSSFLDPLFKGDTITLASGVTISPVNSGARDKSAMGYKEGRLWWSYASGGASTADETLVYDFATKDWVSDSRGFGAFYDEGTAGNLLGGTPAGALVSLESGTDDAGTGITVDFFSRYEDQGAPDLEKTYEDLTLDIDMGGAAATITAYLNDGGSNVVLTSITSVATSGRTRAILPFTASGIGSVARNVAIRIQGTAGSTPIRIFDAYINYYLESREAKRFDTDEVNFGNGKMSAVREWRIDLINSGTVTLHHYSDQVAGSTFSQAVADETETILAVATRRLEPVVFSTDIKGNLHRLVLTGSNFKLYSAQALVKIYGTYLFGSKGEYYLSDPLDFGTERIKLVREIQVIYDAPAATAAYTYYTDLPGTAGLVSRQTGTLATTTGEETLKIPLLGTVQGRLIQFGIVPTGDFILYGLRMWVKSIGQPAASPWTWVDLPVEPTRDAIWVSVPVPIDEAV